MSAGLWRMVPIRLVRYPLRSNDLNLRRLKGFVKSDFEVFAFVGGSLASTKINGERERKFHVRQDVTCVKMSRRYVSRGLYDNLLVTQTLTRYVADTGGVIRSAAT